MKYNFEIIDGEYGWKRFKFSDEISVIEYLLFDMEAFREPIFLPFIEKVLKGESTFEEFSGHICSLEIYKDTTKAINHYITDDMQEECIIETSELKAIIELWVVENKHKDILNN